MQSTTNTNTSLANHWKLCRCVGYLNAVSRKTNKSKLKIKNPSTFQLPIGKTEKNNGKTRVLMQHEFY